MLPGNAVRELMRLNLLPAGQLRHHPCSSVKVLWPHRHWGTIASCSLTVARIGHSAFSRAHQQSKAAGSGRLACRS